MNAVENSVKHLYLAICDDEKTASDFLFASVQKWAKARKIHIDIFVFASAEAFLFAFPESKIDMMLLDIQMGGEDGLSLAKKLRVQNSDIEIIFVTGYKDYVFEGYSVSALDFIVKPVKEDALFTALDRGIARLGGIKRKTLLLTTAEGDNVRIYEDEIIYAEAERHFVRVVTVCCDYYIKKNISALAVELSLAFFCRPHRSYVVSVLFIKSITKTDIILDNGVKIPISRLNYKTINDAFIRYYRGDAHAQIH